MSQKSIILIGMFIGSSLGGLIPALWGADLLSFSSIIFSTLGGLIGIWLGYKLSA